LWAARPARRIRWQARVHVRRGLRVRRPGAAERARPGPARDRHPLRLQGALAEIVQEKDALAIHTDSELRAKAIRDLVESKAIRRNLSLKIFDWGPIEQAGGMTVRQRVELRRGLSDDLARKITKLIRDEFPKVRSQIQGDAVRVAAKSKDDLQKVIARLRELDEAVPLQFMNYR